ncbi:TPA: hypothetical protein SAY52_005760 [Burkholderia cenocepacia]|uniref:hypothetical protein n=1 Tax=unclassified Burkholderia TaxID=2613784 RepID=UPI00158EDCAF|nr:MULTISPECIES: hypothetical protein [unclassified Burkholderia]HEF5875070.1 hypothetical protein [Burkholderia cenocepacia]
MTARRDTYRAPGPGEQIGLRFTPTGDARSLADATRMRSFAAEPRGAAFISHAELPARDRDAAANRHVPAAPEPTELADRVGATLAARQSVVDSVRRYGRGDELIFFAPGTAPDGWRHAGASTLTVAYREVAVLLRPVILAERRARSAPVTNTRTSDGTTHNVRSDTRRNGPKLRTIGLALAGTIVVCALVAFMVVHGPAGWTYWLYNRDSTAFLIR